MRIISATLTALALCLLSFGMIAAADEATDAAAIVGGTGLVVAGALLGLTMLAWRWRSGSTAYTSTAIDRAGFYEELASSLDEGTEGYDDSVAMRAAN